MADPLVRGIVLGEDPSMLARLGLDARRAGNGTTATCVGGVAVHAVGTDGGRGLLAFDLGPDARAPVPTETMPTISAGAAGFDHPLGALAVDHVVVLAGDADATVAAFGVEPRRREERGGQVYAYIVAGSCLIEVVAPVVTDDRPPTLWGLALSVRDLDAAAAYLGDACSAPKAAVQPGRRIATVRGDVLGLATPLALLSPRG
jgi:hypothetical protein